MNASDKAILEELKTTNKLLAEVVAELKNGPCSGPFILRKATEE